MKKLFAALIASALLIPALSTDAFAGGQYPGTVKTSVKLSAPSNVSVGEVFKVNATLKVASGRPVAARAAGPCHGTMVVVVSKGKNKAKVRSAPTSGGTTTFQFKLGSVGPWKIKGSFHPNASSPCRASSRTRTITVS